MNGGQSHNSKETKYVGFSPSSLRLFAEQAGYSHLDDSIFKLLSEDVTYRLRELITTARNFMKNSNQTELTVDSVNETLRWTDCKPIYGHTINKRPIKSTYIKDANVFVNVDADISISELSSQILSGKRKLDLKERHVSTLGNWIALKNANPVNCSNTLPDPLMAYYNFFIGIVYSSDFELYKRALSDLASNSALVDLLPNLLSFIELGINDINPSEANLFRLLMLANAVIRNRAFHTEISRNLVCLLDSLLFCIVEPIGQRSSHEELLWTLREYAATVLSIVLRIWSDVLIRNDILINLLNYLSAQLCDKSRSLDCHFGIICVFRNLGVNFIGNFLYPLVPEFVSGLEKLMEESEFNLNSESQLAVIKVNRTLEVVMLNFVRRLKQMENNHSCSIVCPLLCELFGDSFAARIGVQYVSQKYTYKKPVEEPNRIFSAPEESGEQLLETFYTPNGTVTRCESQATITSQLILDNYDSGKNNKNGFKRSPTEPHPKRRKFCDKNLIQKKDATEDCELIKQPLIYKKGIKIKISNVNPLNRPLKQRFFNPHNVFTGYSATYRRKSLVGKDYMLLYKQKSKERWQQKLFSCDLDCVL